MGEKSNVVSLHGDTLPALGEPNEGLIEAIEDLLAKAKDGQLQSFIGTGFTSDNGRLSIVCGATQQNIYEVLGAMEWLKVEYVDYIKRENSKD